MAPIYLSVLGIKRCAEILFWGGGGWGVDGLFLLYMGDSLRFEAYHLGEMRAEVEEKRDSVH